jgi:hypothetical protein
MSRMNTLIALGFAAVLFCPLAWSATLAAATAPNAKLDKEAREDIARHRAMAAAHEAAAKCREAGTAEDVCIKALTAACKGLAIGKYCGMKHEH